MTTYVAFESSARLFRNTDDFINEMRGGSTRPNPAAITAIMTDFTSEGVQAFFIRPLDIVGLTGAPRKIVEFTGNTITTTTGALVKQTAKKLDIDQNRTAAEYMDTMRMQQEGVWYVSFPLSDAFAKRIRDAIATARNEGPQAAMPQLTRNLHELTDIALKYYFEQPIEIMRFGPILRKLVSVGLDTIRKVTKQAIDKVFTKMSDEQVLKSCAYMEELLVDGPHRDA